MLIKKITLNNFMAFAGAKTIELSTDENKPFTTIIGANGTGKTSLCDAVNWCLFGEISQLKLKHIKYKDSLENDDTYVEIEAKVKKSSYIIRRSLLGNKYTELDIIKNSKLTREAENELRTIMPIFLNEALVVNSENLDESIFYESQPPARRNFIFDLLFDSSTKISTHKLVLNTFFKSILGNENQINIDSQKRIINILSPQGTQDIRITMSSDDIKILNIYLIMALHTLIHKEVSFPIFFDSIFSNLGEDKKNALISLFASSQAQIIFLELPAFIDSNLFQKIIKDKSFKSSLLNFSPITNTLEISNL